MGNMEHLEPHGLQVYDRTVNPHIRSDVATYTGETRRGPKWG